ncbi:unnamed protein product, partial [Prorocentrum cordatum]
MTDPGIHRRWAADRKTTPGLEDFRTPCGNLNVFALVLPRGWGEEVSPCARALPPRGQDLDRAELKGPPPDCLLARGWRNQVHGQAPASRCLAHVVVHLRVLSTASSSSSSCLARPAADLGTDGLGPPIAEDVARLGRRPRGLPAGRRAPGHGAARRAPRAASEPCRTDLHMTSSASGTGHANQQPGRRPRCAASRSAAAAARSAPGQPKRREALRPGAAHSAGRGAASAEACAPR